MCGRFALDQSLDELMAEFAATHNKFPHWTPRWNIAPTTTIPIVVERSKGIREIGPARWSLIPEWSPTAVLKYPTFNARSETAAEKPTFRESVRKRRCLIPATGFYEWKELGGKKSPHFIRRIDATVFAFAGLYSWWTNPEDGTQIATTTILTRDSTTPLSEVHDRMPVFVAEGQYEQWLDPAVTSGQELVKKVASESVALSANFEYFRVAPLVGDGPHLLEEHQKGSV
jgi:putative SOS response-associated peptidase YedK